ncbi:hypothetical protein BTO30_11025 [Domibacillus antri]|uniref:Uncharacterized protein n=1 Tax=Domibacillus antri TaxID=1714264 RepID=A0A1Q8Q4Q2_9BACI|nr:hypothetical protein BTO30_11025 [Domibacillus antri]
MTTWKAIRNYFDSIIKTLIKKNIRLILNKITLLLSNFSCSAASNQSLLFHNKGPAKHPKTKPIKKRTLLATNTTPVKK